MLTVGEEDHLLGTEAHTTAPHVWVVHRDQNDMRPTAQLRPCLLGLIVADNDQRRCVPLRPGGRQIMRYVDIDAGCCGKPQ